MTSTDMTVAGVTNETSPAVVLRCAGSTDLAAGTMRYAAPWTGTGLPIAGNAVRLRGLIATAGTTGSDATGAPFGTDALPSAQLPAMAGLVSAGASQHTSNTPGDLPPEDPLS